MREPQTWYDKSLLEDEPFLSAFKGRRLAAPPTRRRAGPARGKDSNDHARNKAIVEKIRDMKLVSFSIPSTFYKQLHRPQLQTVQAWLSLAFKPHCKDIWQGARAYAHEPGMIYLFVHFYWALSHDHEIAVRILERARKRRGYVNALEKLTMRGGELVPTADLREQVHPKQTSQIRDDAFQSTSKMVPGISDPIFQNNLNTKKDAPGCSEREGKSSSQTCPPSLDPTSLSVTRQIKFDPSTLPLPPDSQNTTAICDLPKKRERRQISPDRRRIKHRKINETTSVTSKLCNVSRFRNDVIDEKTEVRPSQREDISDRADHVSALRAQPPFKKMRGLPPGLKFNKNLKAKDVPGCPEREGKGSSQTCPPSLDPASLSVTRKIEFIPSTLPLPPDSQNTRDLPKPRKRQTSPDTPRKKHQGINEATSDASKLEDNNNLEPQCLVWACFERKEDIFSLSCPLVATPTSESTRIELDETVLSLPSNAPVPLIHDPQREDATRQPKQYGTTSNPKKRRASNSEDHQCKRQGVPVDQEASVPIIVQPDLAKKKRGRPPKVKEGQEGSASITMQPAPRKKKDRPLKSQAQLSAWTVVPLSGQNVDMTQETSTTACIPFSPAQHKGQEVPVKQDSIPIIVQPYLARKKRPPKVKEGQDDSASITVQPAPEWKKDQPLKSQAQLNAGTVVPFSGQNVDMMTQETSITSCIPFSPSQSSHVVSDLQETVEGLSRHDRVPWSMLDRGTKEEIIINRPGNWLWTQEYGLVEEDFTLDCEALAATQMDDRPTDIFPSQKPPLCVNPPIWAQVRDITLRYNKLSSAFLSSPAKKFVKPLIGFGAIKVVFILRTMQ